MNWSHVQRVLNAEHYRPPTQGDKLRKPSKQAKPFACPNCLREFRNSAAMQLHIKEVHEEQYKENEDV